MHHLFHVKYKLYIYWLYLLSSCMEVCWTRPQSGWPMEVYFQKCAHGIPYCCFFLAFILLEVCRIFFSLGITIYSSEFCFFSSSSRLWLALKFELQESLVWWLVCYCHLHLHPALDCLALSSNLYWNIVLFLLPCCRKSNPIGQSFLFLITSYFIVMRVPVACVDYDTCATTLILFLHQVV